MYRYAFSFPNTGGVSTPLILAFYGTAGLFQNSMFTFVTGIVCYTWGIMQLQPAEGGHDLRFFLRRLFSANFIAMLIGLVLGVLGAKTWMPKIIVTTVQDLGSCYVTTRCCSPGFSIADYPVHAVLGDKRSISFPSCGCWYFRRCFCC